MIIICLAFFIAFPVLLLLHENPPAYYFFLSATIFVTGSVVLMLIFIPKIRFYRQQAKHPEKNKRVRVSISGHNMLDSRSGSQPVISTMSITSSSDPQEGLLVLSHPKTETMLSGRIKKLEMQLREFTNHNSSRFVSSPMKYEDPEQSEPMIKDKSEWPMVNDKSAATEQSPELPAGPSNTSEKPKTSKSSEPSKSSESSDIIDG